MKKILSALLVAGATTCANAQYFEGTYGTTSALEKLTSGHNVSGGGVGHFMMSQTSTANGGNLLLVRTDQNGSSTSGSPAFNNIYKVGAGTLNNGKGKSLEYNAGGSAFAVASAWQVPNTTTWGIYLLQLSNTGGINGIVSYVPAFASPWNDMMVTGITESGQTPGEIYVCGYIREITTGYAHVFVLKIDNTGTLLWSNIYDLNNSVSYNYEMPYGIIESSNFNGTTNTWEVMVVGSYGEHPTPNTNTEDAFILRIDYNTGNTTAGVQIFGLATTSGRDAFSSIRNSANPNVVASADGYVLSGYTDFNGSIDFWTMAIDQQATTIAWSNTFDYSGGTGHIDYCYDIIERLNTMGSPQYEYYLTGETDNGPNGGLDVMVIKADQNGNGVTGGEFLYGTANNDLGIQSDQLNGIGTNQDGLCIFAQQDITGGVSYDQYMIKAYFNGIGACGQTLNNPSQNTGPGYITSYTPTTLGTFSGSTISCTLVANGGEVINCSSTSVTGGNNTKEHKNAGKTPGAPDNTGIFPNPAQSGTAEVDVKLNFSNAAAAEMKVVDLLGRVYHTSTVQTTAGESHVKLQLPALKAGTYLVTVTSASDQYKTVLMVK